MALDTLRDGPVEHAGPAKRGAPSPISRRSLLKAGWALPVIAATPLMNTASAMSVFNCDRMFDKMIDSINTGDVEKAQKTLQQLLDNGCKF